ncbi:hypothetical protein C8A01DRAFT_31960 [Parachaetomium inaequale]|uniref:Uncharacterized protein n=1 Tax=Parachaetomium inaequale TaxID=2588326 RepID=A0AAN6PPI8_9PEZI|nr:hypothetical protein C8A01DRAFT_31960 [Parachaetomium inaequale]
MATSALPPPLYCDTTSCDLDPLVCSQDNDEWGNPFLSKRDSIITVADDDDGVSLLEKRGGKQPYTWKTAAGVFITQYSLTYRTPGAYMRNIQAGLQGIARRWWRVRSRSCNDPAVSPQELERDQAPPDTSQVEHTVPAVTIARFASVVNHGRHWAPHPAGRRRSDRNGGWIELGQMTPEGPPTRTEAITNREFWENVWNNAEGLPPNLAPVTPNSPDLRRPVDRLYEALGSNTNAPHFTLLEGNINGMKGQIETFNSPMARDRLRRYVRRALDPGESDPAASIESFMAPFRETRGVFQYLRSNDVVTRLDTVTAAIYTQLQFLELNIPEARGLAAHWNEFYPYYFSQVSQFARDWASTQIAYIREQYNANPRAYNREKVLKQLKEIEDDIPNWKYAFED